MFCAPSSPNSLHFGSPADGPGSSSPCRVPPIASLLLMGTVEQARSQAAICASIHTAWLGPYPPAVFSQAGMDNGNS